MTPSPAFCTAARRLLGTVAMLAFMLNVGTPTIMHGCEHEGMAGEAAHHEHQGHKAPASQDQKQCHCVGLSCSSAMVVPVGVADAVFPVRITHRIESFQQDGHRPVVASHLLPFAIGPPSSILA